MSYPSNNNSSVNSELFANLVTAAQFSAYENSVARQITTVFDAPYNAGKVLQVPVWAGVSADVLTEEGAATAKTTNTTSASITLDELVVYHQVTDRLRDSAYSDVMSQLGNQSGMAIAEAMDKQVFDLFTSFSNEVGPGAGGEVTVDHILKAVAQLRSQKLTGPMVAVLHPKQAYNLKKALTATTAYTANTAVGNGILSNYFIGQIAGVTIIESALISVDGSDDAIGAVFAPSAIGLANRGTIEMETQRQAAARATDVVVKAYSGAAILQNAHGVKITGDAAL